MSQNFKIGNKVFSPLGRHFKIMYSSVCEKLYLENLTHIYLALEK